MKTEGKKFKLFIGDEEIADGIMTDCSLDLLENAKEVSESKTSRQWSAACIMDINPCSVNDFCRAVMLEEIRVLTANYNRVMRIKNK